MNWIDKSGNARKRLSAARGGIADMIYLCDEIGLPRLSEALREVMANIEVGMCDYESAVIEISNTLFAATQESSLNTLKTALAMNEVRDGEK